MQLTLVELMAAANAAAATPGKAAASSADDGLFASLLSSLSAARTTGGVPPPVNGAAPPAEGDAEPEAESETALVAESGDGKAEAASPAPLIVAAAVVEDGEAKPEKAITPVATSRPKAEASEALVKLASQGKPVDADVDPKTFVAKTTVEANAPPGKNIPLDPPSKGDLKSVPANVVQVKAETNAPEALLIAKAATTEADPVETAPAKVPNAPPAKSEAPAALEVSKPTAPPLEAASPKPVESEGSRLARVLATSETVARERVEAPAKPELPPVKPAVSTEPPAKPLGVPRGGEVLTKAPEAAFEQTVRVAETAPLPASLMRKAEAKAQPANTEPARPTPVTGAAPQTESVKAESPEALQANPPPKPVAPNAGAVETEEPAPPAAKPTLETEVRLARTEPEPIARERVTFEVPSARATKPVAVPAEAGNVAVVQRTEAPAPPVTTAPASAPAEPALPERVALPNVERFALRGVKQLAQQGDGTIRVRIVPEHLGELRIEVQRDGGQLNVKMTSASGVVRDVLESGAHGLREALAREGIEVRQVQVNPPSSGAPYQQTAGGQTQQQQWQQDSHGQRGPGGNAPGQGRPDESTQSQHTHRDDAATRPRHSGELNVWA